MGGWNRGVGQPGHHRVLRQLVPETREVPLAGGCAICGVFPTPTYPFVYERGFKVHRECLPTPTLERRRDGTTLPRHP